MFDKPTQALQGFQSFLATSVQSVLTEHAAADPSAYGLALFHQTAQNVPAYGAFLKSHGVVASSLQTWADVQGEVPLLTKANYIQAYPLADRCREGRLETCDMVAVSSGSTGNPTVWPRFFSDELTMARRFEQVFVESFQADTRRTLAVVCFALGTWVGGMYTASCTRLLAAKGLPITVVTPGNNPAEIFRVLGELGPQFEQVVLLGYPPFLKDVVDAGRAQGIDWPSLHVRWVMAGEVFSEEWRTLMGERLGATQPCYDSASLYGTADAGVLGNETPLSIAIRRFLAQRPEAAQALFGEARLPTLVQYDPLSRLFEALPDGTLAFSGENGVPLLRYHIADTGGVYPYAQLMTRLEALGFDPQAELSGDRGCYPLPFVYVFGRANFAVSYFGANLYPENVSVGLEQPAVQAQVTGKFVMEVQQDEDQNPRLSITVELAPGVQGTESLAETLAVSIQTQLARLNSEFQHYVPAERQRPWVSLRPTGDPDYFPTGVKHRYTRH